jgi:predicted alpha/beta hydrolase family esterase
MTTLLLPGYRGSGEGHWQRLWLEQEPGARMVVQDDWDRPRLAAWLTRLESAVARAEGPVLVAHSLACMLVAHLALRSVTARRVAGALLVAPADIEARRPGLAELASFAPIPRDRLPFPAIVVASRNDPYMTFERAASLADGWCADLVDLGEAGHINVDSGHGPWPYGHDLARLLRRARPEADRRPWQPPSRSRPAGAASPRLDPPSRIPTPSPFPALP